MSVTERAGVEAHPEVPTTAPWVARAGAALLDGAVLLGVAWVVDLGGPAIPLTPWTPHLVVGPGLVLASLVLLLLQARLGVTPGKAVVGIAVVDEDEVRPVGPARTFGRALAHLVDVLPVPVGLLRPLWHPDGRTFADSLSGTLVVRTPAPHTPRRGHLRLSAAVVCTLAVATLLVPTTFRTTTLDATVSGCTDPEGLEASLVLIQHRSAVVRPGWTRDTGTVAVLEPRWSPADGTGDVRVRLRSLVQGTTYDVRHPAAMSPDGLGLSAEPWPTGAEWDVELLDGSGAVVAACGGVVPDDPPVLRMMTS